MYKDDLTTAISTASNRANDSTDATSDGEGLAALGCFYDTYDAAAERQAYYYEMESNAAKRWRLHEYAIARERAGRLLGLQLRLHEAIRRPLHTHHFFNHRYHGRRT